MQEKKSLINEQIRHNQMLVIGPIETLGVKAKQML